MDQADHLQHAQQLTRITAHFLEKNWYQIHQMISHYYHCITSLTSNLMSSEFKGDDSLVQELGHAYQGTTVGILL